MNRRLNKRVGVIVFNVSTRKFILIRKSIRSDGVKVFGFLIDTYWLYQFVKWDNFRVCEYENIYSEVSNQFIISTMSAPINFLIWRTGSWRLRLWWHTIAINENTHWTKAAHYFHCHFNKYWHWTRIAAIEFLIRSIIYIVFFFDHRFFFVFNFTFVKYRATQVKEITIFKPVLRKCFWFHVTFCKVYRVRMLTYWNCLSFLYFNWYMPFILTFRI